MEHTEEDWKNKLTPEQYKVLREKGTERAFTGEYYHNKDNGKYLCAGCGEALFTSETKYDSGSGWPSFYQPVAKDAVKNILDSTHGMTRMEITCAKCGGHLGHVFNDGPNPTGMRYCVNSLSLKFEKE